MLEKKVVCDKCHKPQDVMYELYDPLNRENIIILSCGNKQVSS